MAVEYTYVSRPKQGWIGLDLRSTDLLRTGDAASIAKNVDLTRSGSWISRPGQKTIADSSGALGIARHRTVSATTGETTTTLVRLGTTLSKVTTGTLSITYGGAASSVSCSVLVDSTTSTWKFYLYEDGSQSLAYDMGVGYDEASPKTMANLVTAINAVTGFTASNSGLSTHPCAFLPTTYYESFSSGALSISYEYETAIEQPSTAANPLAGLYAVRNSSEFRLASWTNNQNCLYISSAYDDQKKYDGQKVYRSGLSQPATPSASVVVNATGRTGTNITYKVTFVQKDHQGNFCESDISSASGAVSPAADFVDVSVTTLTASSGFNTDAAMIVGAQVAQTTLNVDNGSGGAHTLKVGDTAYFYDSVSAAYVERTITAKTNSTITISGAGVTVADNDPVSANLRIGLYCQTSATSNWFLVAEYPHNSWQATQVIRDTGTTLGAEYIDPLPGAEHGLPPRGRYITTFKGLNFVAGNLTNPDAVYYPDVENPEYYPTLNYTEITSDETDTFSGLFPAKKYLLVFKRNSTHVVIGDFDDATGTFRFRVDDVSFKIGCSSHHTIDQLADGTILFLHDKGIFRVTGADYPSDPAEVSNAILPEFLQVRIDDHRYIYSRACGAYDKKNEKYIVFIPTETTTSGNLAANEFSAVFVVDTNGGQWRGYSDLNMGCGIVTKDDDLYFAERRYSSVSGGNTFYLHKFHRRGDEYDFADHVSPIEFEYESGYEDLGNRQGFKKALRMTIFSNDTLFRPSFTLQTTTSLDWRPGEIHTSVNVVFGGSSGSGWGLAPWGQFDWGMPTQPSMRFKLKHGKCKAASVRFYHNTIYATPVISGWEWEFAPSFRLIEKE